MARRKVDPRVCGETTRKGVKAYGVKGRSPRVRGNLSLCFLAQRCAGSIPACAGKP